MRFICCVQGPGDNTSMDDPFVTFTGRLYNKRLVAGLLRVKQGAIGFCIPCT